jgi:hypothetical protein
MSFRSRERRIEKLGELVKTKFAETDLLSTAPQARVIEATRGTFTWVTQYAKTYNEHWVEEGRPDPYEHFPAYDYVRHTFELIDCERVHWFEKSRDMMLSWSLVAYLTLQAMKVPHRGVLFQTQKEDKVVQLIEYAKCLYKTQPRWIQEAYRLKKPIEKQPELELEFAHGGYVAGIPGGADQIR